MTHNCPCYSTVVHSLSSHLQRCCFSPPTTVFLYRHRPTMIFRRLFYKGYCRRWWPHPYTTTTVASLPPSTVVGGQMTPSFFGFLYKGYAFRHDGDLNFPYGMKKCYLSTHALVDVPVDGIVNIPLAQTGEGIAECELLKWFVEEGDQVDEFQSLCEVQSDKATIEITSRYKGKVSQVLHVPGDIVKVGETLLKMVVGESLLPTQTFDTSENMKSLGSDTSDSDGESLVPKKINVGGILSTPAVRNLAKQYSININDVCGTGKDGRVLREDIVKHAANKDRHPDVSDAYGWDYEDRTVPLRGFQRAMVKSMTLAVKVPHFHYVEEINCGALVELKESFQKENSDPDVKHTFLPVFIKSLSLALSRHPLLNSSFNEELHEVTFKGSHNIGIAMASPYGLVVPNIKKVQSLSILEITKELSRLHQLALANKLSPDDISGGTITLSNIGAIGGKFGSPLVNVPEVAIIAMGRIQKVPHFSDDGNVYPMPVMTVNIGADHRVLDGAAVATFCNDWKLFVEKPELLILHMR